MRQFIILYKKELKQIRSALIVLCIIYLSIFLYALSLNSFEPTKDYISTIFLLIAVGVLWAGPFVFAYSLHEEWKCKTVYQLHSLPIHRCTMMLSTSLVGVLILVSGIACGTMGAALSVKRYRWTLGAVVCTMMFYAAYKFDNFFKRLIYSAFGKIESNLFFDSNPSMIIMGIVLMIFGLILYEKFAEL